MSHQVSTSRSSEANKYLALGRFFCSFWFSILCFAVSQFPVLFIFFLFFFLLLPQSHQNEENIITFGRDSLLCLENLIFVTCFLQSHCLLLVICSYKTTPQADEKMEDSDLSSSLPWGSDGSVHSRQIAFILIEWSTMGHTEGSAGIIQIWWLKYRWKQETEHSQALNWDWNSILRGKTGISELNASFWHGVHIITHCLVKMS